MFFFLFLKKYEQKKKNPPKEILFFSFSIYLKFKELYEQLQVVKLSLSPLVSLNENMFR